MVSWPVFLLLHVGAAHGSPVRAPSSALHAGSATSCSSSELSTPLRDNLFLFVHIQKNGGASFVPVFQQHPLTPCVSWNTTDGSGYPVMGYADGGDSTDEAVPTLASGLLEAFPNDWCKGGQQGSTHVSLGALRLAAFAAHKYHPKFLAFVREPVARVLSEWNSKRRNDEAHLPSDNAVVAAAGDMIGGWEYSDQWETDAEGSLASFLNCSACKVGWSNRQTRMLGVRGSELDVVVDEKLFEKALSNIDQMTWVGLTERWADSVQLLMYILRETMPHVPSFTVDIGAHTGRPADAPTDEERAFLEQANAYDTRLVAAATKRFECQWAQMMADTSFAPRNLRYKTLDNVTYTLEPAAP